jgi:hypothetical protein
MTAQTLKRFTIGPAFLSINPVKIFAFNWLNALDQAKQIFPGSGTLKISEILDWPAD